MTTIWIGFGNLSSSFYYCYGLDNSHCRCALYREHEKASETTRKTWIDGGPGFCSHPRSIARKDSDSSVCIFLWGKRFGKPSFVGDNVRRPCFGFGFGFDIEHRDDLGCPCLPLDVWNCPVHANLEVLIFLVECDRSSDPVASPVRTCGRDPVLQRFFPVDCCRDVCYSLSCHCWTFSPRSLVAQWGQ